MADSSGDGHLIILFLTISILIGLLLTHLVERLPRFPVPYEVLTLISGVLLGLLLLSPSSSTVDLVEAVRLFSNVNPNLLLFVFLPILLFDSAFSINFHTLHTVIAPTLLLAVPGVVVITALTAGLVFLLFPHGWSVLPCLLFASLLSATDPVSTVAIMKRSHAFAQLTTIVEAEALLNDGVAFVLYSLFLNLCLAQAGDAGAGAPGVVGSGGISGLNVGAEIGDVVRNSVGGPLFGWVSALFAALLLSRLPHHMAVEVTGTVLAAYLTYLLSSSYVGSSGILSLVVFGVFMSKWRSAALSPSVHHALHVVWHWLVFVANTVLFTILGVIVSRSLFLTSGIGAADVGYTVLLYIVLHVTRVAAVVCLFPLSRLCGYTLSWREAIMLSAAGLRGPISLMLALLTALETGLDPNLTSKVVWHTAGIVLLSNVINGSASKRLVHALRLNEEALEDRIVLGDAMRRLQRSAEEELARRSDLAQLDIDESFICCWRRIRSDAIDDAVLSSAQWESALTVRCLNVLKAEFARMFERCVLSPSAFDQMSAACDAAVDRGSFATFTTAIDALLRVPRHVHFGWEMPVTGWLHRPFSYMLAKHHLRSLEVAMSIVHSLPLCRAVIDAFTSISCVDDDVREQLRDAVRDYDARMNRRMVDMGRAFPDAAKQLQKLRAFLALSAHQGQRASELADVGLLTAPQWKALQNTVQEQLQQHQPAVSSTPFPDGISSALASGRDLRSLYSQGRLRLYQAGDVVLEAKAPVDEVVVVIRGLVRPGSASPPRVLQARVGCVRTCEIIDFDQREPLDGGAWVAEGAGSAVGLYSALTSRPALPVKAVTTVEGLALPISAVLAAHRTQVDCETMWKAAAVELIGASCPLSLLDPNARQEPGWPLRLAHSAQWITRSRVPRCWPAQSGAYLLVLQGSVVLSISAEEHLVLRAPAWVEDAVDESSTDAISLSPSKDAIALWWAPSEDGEFLANGLLETGRGAVVHDIISDPPRLRVSNSDSDPIDYDDEDSQSPLSHLVRASVAADVEMTVRYAE